MPNRVPVSRPRGVAVRVALGVLLLTGSTLAWSTRTVSAADDLLPDLAMARPLDIRVERSGGRRVLRLTTMIVNIGDGPFEARASRPSAADQTMVVKQRVYDAAGGYRVVTTQAVAAYSGDGHDHWHVLGVAAYELYPVSPEPAALRRSSKVGFCFYDTRAYRLSLTGAPGSRRYAASGCGTRAALSARYGISVGWADRYGSGLPFQAIDVTTLPAGDYVLKVTADPAGAFLEGNESNNCNWTRIRLRRSGTLVSTLGWGAGCALPGGSEATPSPPNAGPA